MISPQGIEICKKWIDAGHIQPRKTINKSMSSYGMKEFVERWSGEYVTNEEFIRAMVDKGYRAEKSGASPNYLFNWSYTKGNDWYSVQKREQ